MFLGGEGVQYRQHAGEHGRPQRLDTVQTGKSNECEHSAKKMKYNPSEAKWQADKTCSMVRASLGVAFSRSTEGEAGKSDVELACFVLDR